MLLNVQEPLCLITVVLELTPWSRSENKNVTPSELLEQDLLARHLNNQAKKISPAWSPAPLISYSIGNLPWLQVFYSLSWLSMDRIAQSLPAQPLIAASKCTLVVAGRESRKASPSSVCAPQPGGTNYLFMSSCRRFVFIVILQMKGWKGSFCFLFWVVLMRSRFEC